MLFGVGCTPEGNETAGDEAMAEIAVSPTSFATDLEGGEQVITVTSNATWTVSCDQADVTIEPLTGNGNGTVTITVPAAAQREFKVVFDAQKQTTIPALGTSTTTTAKAEVAVSQNAGGVNLDDYLFYEDCGEDVEKNSEGYWPYVDAFEGWNPQGEAAANVAYKGTQASVRASGNAYQPTSDAVGISGQPYVFLNKVPASAYFVIENIAVTGGSNYIFTYNAQCQNGYSGSPTFATVDGSLIHLELGYDGVNWDVVECTYTPNGGNGWYAVQTEFKVAADATKLYARFTYEAPASNGGGRFDDFKLVAGGNGAELEVSAPEAPTTQEGTIAAITTTGNFSVKNAWVIATYAQGFLMTDSSNAVLLVYQGTGANVPAVGTVVNVAGTVSTYAGFLQFAKDGLTVEATGETKVVTNPTPEVMSGSALDAWLKSASIKYVEYVGQLTISGNYYNVTIPGASTAIGSVQYPADAIKTTLDGLSGKYIKVTGWLIGYSQSKYTNTMATAVVETEAPETPETPGGGETPDTPEVPVIPEGGNALEVTTASVKAAIPDLTTNGYGSQNVTSISTYLTWDYFTACKVCLPPAGDYATANCLQMQGNTDAAKQGRIGNVSATPKRITKIIVESYNAKYTPNFNLALGTEQVVGTSVPANMIPAETMTTSSVVEGNLTKYVSTYEVTSGDYTYFALYKNTTGAFYFTKIRVEYAE